MSTSIDAWRGIAEETEDVSSDASIRLRRRSRHLLWSLLTPHKRALFLSTLLIILHTGAQLSLPYLVGRGIDKAIKPLAGAHGDPRTLWTIAVILLGAVFTASAADRWFLSLTGKLGQDVLFDLRTRLFAHLQKLGIAFYERFTSGRVVARMTSDIDAISELLQTGLTSLAWAALSVVGIMVILLRLSLALGLVTLLSFPLILLLTHWFRRHSEQSYRAVRNAVALVIVHFTESLRGVRAVHAYRREPRNQDIFEDLDAKYRDANIWSSWLAAILGPGVNYLGRLTTLAIVVYGGFLLAHGKLTFGVLASFILYVRMFFDPLQELSQFYNVFQSSAAALEKLSGVLEEEPTVPEKVGAVATADIRGAIGFEGVSFGYTSESEVLHEVVLDIPAGQTVALVGETGAGKSTIARLLSRFYDPTVGRITLDGYDLRDIALDLMHSSVVAVTQESFLFSGTVSDNILFGRPSATREEVEAAADAIGAHGFIAALPEGYDTDVKKRGGRLSSGQRQLIAFARAFLADPRVLILDEATSSLDIPTERLVQHALRTLLADRTAFIIAHRLSTVEIADRVLVIDGGRVVEDGAPSDLIAGEGQYAELHRQWLESLAS